MNVCKLAVWFRKIHKGCHLKSFLGCQIGYRACPALKFLSVTNLSFHHLQSLGVSAAVPRTAVSLISDVAPNSSWSHLGGQNTNETLTCQNISTPAACDVFVKLLIFHVFGIATSITTTFLLTLLLFCFEGDRLSCISPSYYQKHYFQTLIFWKSSWSQQLLLLLSTILIFHSFQGNTTHH